jgi:ferrous iron transport protein B
MAAFATLKKEFGSWRWAFGQAAYSTGVAYLVAFAVYQIGGLIL